MASHPIGGNGDHKIRAHIDFVQSLPEVLKQLGSDTTYELLRSDIKSHVKEIETLRHSKDTLRASAVLLKDLERHGRELWNACTRAQREQHIERLTSEHRALLLQARLLAFRCILAGMSLRRSPNVKQHHYLGKLALSLSRHCVTEQNYDIAMLAIGQVADAIESLKARDPSTENEVSVTALEADYLTLRILLSWKQGRHDVAEHMFVKAESMQDNVSVAAVEAMAETTHRIGGEAYDMKDNVSAIRWLRRSKDLILRRPLNSLSPQGSTLRFDICQSLIQALTTDATAPSVEEAQELVSWLENRIGEKPIVLHLRLQLLLRSHEHTVDIDTYAHLLRKLGKSSDVSASLVDFMLYHVKMIREKELGLAIAILDELLYDTILPSRKTDCVEKAVLCRIWLSSTDCEGLHHQSKLAELLDCVSQNLNTMSPDICGACHCLLWKKAEDSMAEDRPTEAQGWCSLALHPIFDARGDDNRARFGRKLMLCHIRSNDGESARVAFDNLPSSAQSETLSLFLLFKVALMCWNSVLASQTLHQLCASSHASHKEDMLYACLKEAQTAGDKVCTLVALKGLIDDWTVGSPCSRNLTSILRCAIRLRQGMKNTGEHHEPSDDGSSLHIQDTIAMYEKAAQHAQQDPRTEDGHKIFTVQELDWFRKNVYNLGVAGCDEGTMQQVMRIFTICLSFICCYPPDLPSDKAFEVAMMAMNCHFILTAALISAARCDEDDEIALQHYVEARYHIGEFEKRSREEAYQQDVTALKQLLAKTCTLHVFDFEAAVALRAWKNLPQIVQKASVCRDEDMLKAMGDCLLRSHAPGEVVYQVMRLIVNEISSLGNCDNVKLAKYLRCVIQAVLPSEETMTLRVIDQAIQVAKESISVGKPFPPTELEWITATVFNHSIDFYAKGEEDACSRWALKARELAEVMDDAGSMKRLVEEKYAKLKLDCTLGESG